MSLFPSKEFRDNWSHFFWMSLVAIVLSLVGGSIRLLPWFAIMEIMDFSRHAVDHHREKPHHPILEHSRWLGVPMIGLMILGMLIAPSVTRTVAASQVSGGVVMAFVTLPLLAAQRIVSKNIHLLDHGELRKMYNEDREKWINQIAWDFAGIVTMLIASAGLQHMFIAR